MLSRAGFRSIVGAFVTGPRRRGAKKKKEARHAWVVHPMVGRSGCPCQGPANSRCYPHCLSVLSCATSHCGLGRGCRAPGGWCGARLWRPPEEAAARCWSARAPRHSPRCTARTRPRLGACRTAQNCSHHCCPHRHCGTFCQGAVSWDLCHVCRLGRPHDYLDSVGKGRAALLYQAPVSAP